MRKSPWLVLLVCGVLVCGAGALVLVWWGGMPGGTTVSVVVSVTSLVYLAVFASAKLRTTRTPAWSRVLGLAAPVVAGAALGMGAWQVRSAQSHPQGAWTSTDVAWVLAGLAALTAAAYQWPARYFRLLAVLLAVQGVALLAVVGRGVVLDDRAADARAAVSTSDSTLAGLTVPATAPAAPAQGATAQAAPAAQSSLSEACSVAGGAMVPLGQESGGPGGPEDAYAGQPPYAVAEVCMPASGDEPDLPPAEVSIAVAAAQVEVAGLVDEVIGDEATGAALVQAESDLAQAQLAAVDGQGEALLVADAVIAGADAAVAQLTGIADDDAPVPWELATLGWIVILVLATFGYRRLELLNAGTVPGPVTFIADEKSDDDVSAQVRVHLLKNFPEPGVQPGSQAITSVTDLASLDPRYGQVAKALIGFLNATLVPARGYWVKVTAVMDPAHEGVVASCVLVIGSRRTDETLQTIVEPAATDTVTSSGKGVADDPHRWVRRASYRAAAWILRQSRGVPPWLQWPDDVATAYADTALTCDTKSMTQRLAATREAADAAVALGNAYDLDRQPVEACLAYARCLYLWPDYSLARYRMAAVLAAIPGWDAMWRQFEARALSTDPTESYLWDVVLEGRGSDVERERLGREEALRASRRQYLRVCGEGLILPVRRLSIRERGAAPHLSRWYRTVLGAYLASRVPTVALDDDPEPRGPALWWARRSRQAGIGYNRACWHSAAAAALRSHGRDEDAAAQRRAAAVALATSLGSPGASALSAKWIVVDPDIQELRIDPLWESIRARYGLS